MRGPSNTSKDLVEYLCLSSCSEGSVGVPPVGLDNYPVEEFDSIVRFNLTAPFALVKQVNEIKNRERGIGAKEGRENYLEGRSKSGKK
jgi:hypothetical protein